MIYLFTKSMRKRGDIFSLFFFYEVLRAAAHGFVVWNKRFVVERWWWLERLRQKINLP